MRVCTPLVSRDFLCSKGAYGSALVSLLRDWNAALYFPHLGLKKRTVRAVCACTVARLMGAWLCACAAWRGPSRHAL